MQELQRNEVLWNVVTLDLVHQRWRERREHARMIAETQGKMNGSRVRVEGGEEALGDDYLASLFEEPLPKTERETPDDSLETETEASPDLPM